MSKNVHDQCWGERKKGRSGKRERESRGGKAGREGEGERRGERGGESAEAGVN